MEIGSRLKNARNEHGLTQEQAVDFFSTFKLRWSSRFCNRYWYRHDHTNSKIQKANGVI